MNFLLHNLDLLIATICVVVIATFVIIDVNTKVELTKELLSSIENRTSTDAPYNRIERLDAEIAKSEMTQ